MKKTTRKIQQFSYARFSLLPKISPTVDRTICILSKRHDLKATLQGEKKKIVFSHESSKLADIS